MAPSWSMDRDYFSTTVLAIIHSPAPRRFHMKFEQHWPRGFRGEVVWNSQHFSHTDVWLPHKCIGKQPWPRRKKVKSQWRTIILATLVDRPSPMICARFSSKACSVLEKKIFKGFYYIWAWQPSWLMDRDFLAIVHSPAPRRHHMKFEQQAKRLQRRSRLKFSTSFSHTNVWRPYKCIGKQTWPRHKKVKCQCTTIILAILVDRPSPMICAKIQP